MRSLERGQNLPHPTQSSIPDFLQQNTFVFGDCLNLLEQHFNRLSNIEKEMIKWLALNREPASFSELQAQLSPSMSAQTLLEVLDSLEARCLVTKVRGIKQRFDRFSLQPIVLEYVADRLLKEMITQVMFQALPSEYYPNLAG